MLLFFIVFLVITIIGCTTNQRAKTFGGTMTINLQPGQKLIVATWKEDDLWYLTRPMRDGETAETHQFHEDSSFGVMQGTVIFKEHK